MLFLPNIAIIVSVLLAADYQAPGIRKILLSACWKFMQLFRLRSAETCFIQYLFGYSNSIWLSYLHNV